MFTVLRMETLDSWDQILYIGMFGCSQYPGGYPMTADNRGCTHDYGYGWLGAFLFFVIIVVGSFVMPTVLIGIVSIKFDEASSYLAARTEMKRKTEAVVLKAVEAMPDFFTPRRLDDIRELFDTLDVDALRDLTLSMAELNTFNFYLFRKLFGVELGPESLEAMFQLQDQKRVSNVGFDDFMRFIWITKEVQRQCEADGAFCLAQFGKPAIEVDAEGWASWAFTMRAVDELSLEQAWTLILTAANAVQGDTLEAKLRFIFDSMNPDGSPSLDMDELVFGMKSYGADFTPRQNEAFIKSVDKNGDGDVSFEEFMATVNATVAARERRAAAAEQKEAAMSMRRSMKTLAKAAPAKAAPAGGAEVGEGLSDKERVEMLIAAASATNAELEAARQRIKELEEALKKANECGAAAARPSKELSTGRLAGPAAEGGGGAPSFVRTMSMSLEMPSMTPSMPAMEMPAFFGLRGKPLGSSL